MRPRIYNILLLLAGMLLTVAATTSCVYNTPGGDEELTLLIKLSPTTPFRAIEQGAANDSYTVDTYKPITLFFYDDQGNPTEPYRVELKSDDDIKKAMSDDGYEIKVRQAVRKVSAVAGRSGVLKPENLESLSIYDLQGLKGADEAQKGGFLYKVPYIASVTDVETDPNNAERLTVTLQPVPNVARLEISGNITIPKESQQAIADDIVAKRMIPYSKDATKYSYVASPCELPIRYITDFTIRGIYVNNYKETPGAAKRNFLDSAKYDLGTQVWTGHNEHMHTLFSELNKANDYAKTMTAKKVDAYQIYPGSAANPEALDHVIVEVEYKLHTRVGYFDAMVYNKEKSGYVYACSRVEEKPVQELRRFITIRKFLVTNTEKSLVSFDPGKIYRIDLSDLSTLFSMNVKPDVTTIDGKTEITPGRERTDERPEETSAAVRVDVSGWTHININTELE